MGLNYVQGQIVVILPWYMKLVGPWPGELSGSCLRRALYLSPPWQQVGKLALCSYSSVNQGVGAELSQDIKGLLLDIKMLIHRWAT